MECQVPEAIIKLRQGFGRLIRSQHDRGAVVILDPRIHTKHYGRAFVQSLPDCEIINEHVAQADDAEQWSTGSAAGRPQRGGSMSPLARTAPKSCP